VKPKTTVLRASYTSEESTKAATAPDL